jgi:hypothetical protein
VILKSLSPPARCRQAAVATADMDASDTARLRGASAGRIKHGSHLGFTKIYFHGLQLDSQAAWRHKPV